MTKWETRHRRRERGLEEKCGESREAAEADISKYSLQWALKAVRSYLGFIARREIYVP